MGKVLEDVSLDPDTADEAAAIESLEEDEGICEGVEDPTIFQPDTPSTSAASPEAHEVPQQPSSDSAVRSATTIMCMWWQGRG